MYERTPDHTESGENLLPSLDLTRNNKISVSDNALVNPLNFRLEQMKRNLHNMVYENPNPKKPHPQNQNKPVVLQQRTESTVIQD